jgi:hypothetical protein
VRRIPRFLFLTCIALLLAHAAAGGAVAEPGSRTRDRVPSELWKAYPLNPGAGRVQAGHEPGTSIRSNRTSARNRPETADADEQAPAGDKTPWAIGLLGVLVLVALLALRLVAAPVVAADGQRPGFVARLPGWKRLERAARGGRGPRTPRSQMSVKRAEKGSTMDKWRRRARAQRSEGAPRRGNQEAGQVDQETLPVERVSAYLNRGGAGEEAVTEDQVEAAEDQPEETPAEVPPDAAAEVVGAEAAAGLTAVGEEVQAVISSAHEAAAAIRRKAEAEAKRVLDDAWAAGRAEITEAQRIGAAHREEAEHIRAEAEAFSAEARAAAETFTQELRTNAEREAARIDERARERLSAAEADATRKVERAEDEARERIGSLHDEIERSEERLQNLLVILRGMSAQVEDVLAGRSSSGETADESLEDALRLERSSEAVEGAAGDEPARSVAAGDNHDDPADENA